MKKYIELTISTTHIGSELVSDILSTYTSFGVSISDIQDVIDLERCGKSWDYADESIYSQDKTVLIKGYYEKRSAKKIIALIEQDIALLKQNSPFDLGSLEMIKREVDGDCWRKQWKEHFKPIYIDKVVIVPKWIKYKKKSNDTVVLMDSNMAFGTGEHETTAMCVKFLQKYVKDSQTVLDVGCGSGILGIVASKLGAKKVVMTDIDQCAVTASEHNAKLNNIENYQIYLKNLLDDNAIKGDIIVCNIMAEVLIAFAPYLASNLEEDGKIILSGILKDKLKLVREEYQKFGFKYIEDNTQGEWSAIVMQKV